MDEARHLATDLPEAQRQMACNIAARCDAWFVDAVALALACSKAGFRSHVFMGNIRSAESGAIYNILQVPPGITSGITGIALQTSIGLRLQTGTPPDTGKILAEVTNAKVARAQKMASAFRLPETVGLHFGGIGRPFIIGDVELRVMPGFRWLLTKWRIAWAGKDWAVKSSPKLSTFFDALSGKQETLTQAGLSELIAEARLTTGKLTAT
jgi:hypothetical protein